MLKMFLSVFSFAKTKRLKSDSELPKKIIYVTKNPLKMMENAFYCILKALFVFNIFKFLSGRFDHKKRLDLKDQVNFKFHSITTWLTNNSSAHNVQYLTN